MIDKATRKSSTFSMRCGFTLVELLAGLAIIGVLSAILIAGLTTARGSADRTETAAGARSLITAYISTPLENNGRYLLGYGNTGETLVLRDGQRINSAAEDAQRYPWRLAPFLGDGVEGLFVGKHADFFDQVAFDGTYAASLNPSFGLNSTFVGGHADGRQSDPGYKPSGRFANDPVLPKSFWVLRPGDAHNPSNLIVFASSIGSSPPGYEGPVGFYRISAPNAPASIAWGSYDPEVPASLGYVSLEFGGEAVVAHLDGSVKMLNEEELRDMRRWSNQAAKFDDPNFSDWTRK